MKILNLTGIMNRSASSSYGLEDNENRPRKFSYKKINLQNELAPDGLPEYTNDPGIYFSREDKFEGKFY